jgi:hypothetical protein
VQHTGGDFSHAGAMSDFNQLRLHLLEICKRRLNLGISLIQFGV